MRKLYTILLLISFGISAEYIAIIDFEGIGVASQEARSLTQRLTSEMIRLEVYQEYPWMLSGLWIVHFLRLWFQLRFHLIAVLLHIES